MRTRYALAVWHHKTTPNETFGYPINADKRPAHDFPEVNRETCDFQGVIPAGQTVEVVKEGGTNRATVKVAGFKLVTSSWAIG